MRSEALDMSIVNRGHVLRIYLSGPFNSEQAQSFKEKVCGLIEDGNLHLVIDMENVTVMGEDVAGMFLSLVNIIREKNGELKFVFRNEAVSRSFAPYKNLFSIYPDDLSLKTGGFFNFLNYRRKILSRKTGLRISVPVALILLCTLAGWYISMAFIIHIQSQRIHQQERELSELVEHNRKTSAEINILRERIKPLQQLGIIKDTTEIRSHEPFVP